MGNTDSEYLDEHASNTCLHVPAFILLNSVNTNCYFQEWKAFFSMELKIYFIVQVFIDIYLV